MDSIDNLHQWIKDLKARQRHSFGYLGELIGYSDVGFSKALRSNRLSVEQVKLIAEKLNLSQELENYISNFSNKLHNNVNFNQDQTISISGVEMDVKHISQGIIENEELFFKEKYFNMWFNEKVEEALKVILEKQDIKVIFSKH